MFTQYSNTYTNYTMSTQIQLAEIKSTSQEIEQALINIIKADFIIEGQRMANSCKIIKKELRNYARQKNPKNM